MLILGGKPKIRVLIACEFSGVVRDQFLLRGHDAWSCDLLPTESPIQGRHFQGDVRNYIEEGAWDLLIGHPPCTYLANSSNAHLYLDKKFENGPDPERWESMREGAEFFNFLLNAPVPKICLENPIQHCHARKLIPKYTQIIQPWQYGHGETKATCLWLKNLPNLVPTYVVEGRKQRSHYESPGPDRWKRRSRTLLGVGKAIAAQFS